MKQFFWQLILLSVFILSGCDNNSNEEEKDVFDLEWNKDMNIKENTMVYMDIDVEDTEHTVDIGTMRIILFSRTPQNNSHYIHINVNGETFYFNWNDDKQEIIPGIVQLYPYGISPEGDKFITTYRGMMNILEVTQGNWNNELKENPIEAQREINIKAIFHFKKDINLLNGDKTNISKKTETKGIFNYSGIEETGIYMENN